MEIQLVKSAIRTGIEVLLENAGINFKDIDMVIIAGGLVLIYGVFARNVVNIGMFPDVSLDKIIQVGNAAAVGGEDRPFIGKMRKLAESIAEKVDYLELTVFPGFDKHFIDSIMFPEPDRII